MSLRGKAVGMVTAGQTVRKVADEIGVHYSTVSRWCSKHKAGEPLSDKKRCGRPSVQTKVSKIVLSKSLTKKRQSTRKLARRLTANGHPMTHMTVHNYLVKNLGARAFKRRKIPRPSEENRKKRLKFCKERLHWTVNDWEKVFFCKESPYALFPDGNLKKMI